MMTKRACKKMCDVEKMCEKLTEKYITREYVKQRTDPNYKPPIEIVFWCHRMNLPTTDKGGSIYGTNYTFHELFDVLMIGDPNGKKNTN